MRDVPLPEPGLGEIRVRVHASAINRGEVMTRRAQSNRPGNLLAPFPSGIEFAGEVDATGPGVAGIEAGARVMGRCRNGAHAEFVVVDARAAMPVPDAMGWEEAASIPNVFVTAHDAIVTNGQLQAGESVLVTAASSGVGIAALQIAKMAGAHPLFGSTTSAAKLELLNPLGMDTGIDTSSEDLEEAVKAATDGKGVDVIIDNVGGEMLEANLRAMALKGRLVSVGRLGKNSGPCDLDLVALKRLRIIGVTFRTRTPEEALQVSERAAADLAPGFADGRLRGLVDRAFPLELLLEAQEYMLLNQHVGKIVIRI